MSGYDYSDRDECIDAEIEAQEQLREADFDAWTQADYYDVDEERAHIADHLWRAGDDGSDLNIVEQRDRPRRTGEPAGRSSAVKIIKADGTVIEGPLGQDVEAIRALLAEQAGDTFADLTRPTPRGRLTEAEYERRDTLAALIVKARDSGATLEAIGKAIGRPGKTVLVLERRGRELAGLNVTH